MIRSFQLLILHTQRTWPNNFRKKPISHIAEQGKAEKIETMPSRPDDLGHNPPLIMAFAVKKFQKNTAMATTVATEVELFHFHRIVI